MVSNRVLEGSFGSSILPMCPTLRNMILAIPILILTMIYWRASTTRRIHNKALLSDKFSIERSVRRFLASCEKEALMQYVLIIHEVADYEAWKKVFDSAASIRRNAGERSFQVLRYQNDPNRIVHFSMWTSINDAKRFFESPKLVQIRKEAGVKSPDFIYLEQLEAGTL